MREQSEQRRLDLSYPCEWPYVVIGEDEESLRVAVKATVDLRHHTITVSHTSAQGKYLSLKVLVVVHSEEDRIGIYEALQDHPSTKIVI